MILLTGATGFIGRHLLVALQKEYGYDNVIALSSKPIENGKYLLHNNYTFDTDFFIKNGCEKINTIVHAGAFIPKNNTQLNDWENCNTNIYNSGKLLKSNLPELKNIVFLSTVDVYGEDAIINEQTTINPVSLYGYSKLYGEKMILSWAKENNKLAQILRIGHVYGEGEEQYQKLIPLTINNILRNQPVRRFGNGNEIRSFIYIQDVVNCILKSVHLNEFPGEINVAGKESISINALLDKLIQLSNKNISIEQISSSAKSRDLIFDTTKMETCLQKESYRLDTGLQREWNYMQNLLTK